MENRLWHLKLKRQPADRMTWIHGQAGEQVTPHCNVVPTHTIQEQSIDARDHQYLYLSVLILSFSRFFSLHIFDRGRVFKCLWTVDSISIIYHTEEIKWYCLLFPMDTQSGLKMNGP